MKRRWGVGILGLASAVAVLGGGYLAMRIWIAGRVQEPGAWERGQVGVVWAVRWKGTKKAVLQVLQQLGLLESVDRKSDQQSPRGYLHLRRHISLQTVCIRHYPVPLQIPPSPHIHTLIRIPAPPPQQIVVVFGADTQSTLSAHPPGSGGTRPRPTSRVHGRHRCCSPSPSLEQRVQVGKGKNELEKMAVKEREW